MTTLPTSGYMSDNARTQGQMKTAFENVNSTIREMCGGAVHTTATLATDTFTLADDYHTVIVDTEASSASDDLKNIGQTTARAGRTVRIRCTNAARVVVVKNAAGGAGQIATQDGADFSLNDTKAWIDLRYRADTSPTTWEEIGRSERIQMNRLAGMAEESNLTISSDAITPTQFLHELTCQTGTPGSATDDLSALTQTNSIYWVLLHTKTSGDVITVKHNVGSSGKILTVDSADITLNSPNKFVLLMRKSTTWEEVARFNFTQAGHALAAKSSTFTADTGDLTYYCTGTFTANLPALATAIAANTRITLINEGTGVITIDGNSTETVMGSTTQELNPGDAVTLVPCTSNWRYA